MEINNNIPFFSVVLTAYNCEKYINDALDSIACQSFKDYEVIIVDDYSKDTTAFIIQTFIEGKSNWYLHKNSKNHGVAYSRNKAFDQARGQFIAILDSDDIWLENKLLNQYQVLIESKADFCYTSYSLIDDQSKRIAYTYKTQEVADYNRLLKENYIGCSTAVFSKQIANLIKMTENMLNEDYYFWLQVVRHNYKGVGIAEPLVRYRIHKESRSYNKLKAARNRFKIYRKLEKLSMLKSIFSFLSYAFRAVIKYVRIGLRSLKE